MVSLPYEIHFWTLKDELHISNNDIGAYKYHSKSDASQTIFSEKKKDYALGRDYSWTLSNKKPHRLKHLLKEFEETIESQKIVRTKWLKEDTVVLIFNSGIIAHISVNLSTGDIAQIGFDKYLKDKLVSTRISDVLLSNLFCVCCYNNPQFSLIYYSKPAFRKLYRKLADLEPKFTSINLPGSNGRRLPRKLCVNKTGDVIAIWWQNSDSDVFPWSPFVKDVDRANVHIYAVSSSNLEMLCYYRTEHELLQIVFGVLESNVVYIVEQKISRVGDIKIESSAFEVVKHSRLQRVNNVSIPLRSSARCVEFSPDRSNLLVGCQDGSLLLYNQTRALTHFVQTAFVPSMIRWHTNGYLVAVASERGQIQCFDFALCCFKMHRIGEDITSSNIIDLSSYLNQRQTSTDVSQSPTQSPSLTQIDWNANENCNSTCNERFVCEDSVILLVFEAGPAIAIRVLGVANLSPEILVSKYLSADQVENAINVLLAMDWDLCASTCSCLLKKITNYVFVSSKSSSTEKYAQIQTATGSFFFPVRPISRCVHIEFYKSVRNISRRLFHYLLRHGLDDFAFNIASQLNEHDLFMDLYHYAKFVNNLVLLRASEERAKLIITEESVHRDNSESESYDCSSSDCSCNNADNYDCKNDLYSHSQSLTDDITSNRPSFAAVTKVTSQMKIEHSLPAINHLPSPPLISHSTNSKPYNGQILIDSLRKMNLRKAENPEDCTSCTSNLISTRSPSHISAIPNSNLSKNIPPDLARELIQQSGINGSKSIDGKSIKVVHFGVV